MLANGIKETTATTGTGTVTLAAVTGFTRFSAAFAVGDRAAYCIKDGDNREWGVGTVAAGNTLERTYRLGTLVAGVYSSDVAGALTAITLASGAAEVICDVHDLLLPELGLDYLSTPPDPKRLYSPLLGVAHVKTMLPQGGASSTMTILGGTSSGTGTAAARAVSATNLLTSSSRMGRTSAATAGSGASFILQSGTTHRGSGGGRGGFLFVARVAVSDATLVSDARMFVGLHASSASLTNADQSTVNNVVGLNIDAADANFTILHRDATTATKVDLGASFSRANVGNNANILTVTLWAPPSAAYVGYRVRMEGTNPADASGVLTTTLPAPDTALTVHAWRNNAATAAAVDIDLLGVSLVMPQ